MAGSPGDARATLLKGVSTDKGDLTVGLALVERAVSLDPADPQAWYNLGVFESGQSRLGSALHAYERAVALDPTFLPALGNGCELLRRTERFEEALDWADRLLALGERGWSVHLNRAICLMYLRRFEDAGEGFDAARAADPDRPIVHWEHFALMLFEKRFAEAWDDFEWRFACGELNSVFHYPFEAPRWSGEPLERKHLLVHNEQGLGDQIMFACALPEVIAEAAKTTIVVLPEVQPLFAASFPAARVLPARVGRFAGDHPRPDWIGSLGEVDYQLPVGSLMALRRRTPESFADPAPYMRPSDAARERWRRFDGGPGLKVGLCWASNPALFHHDSARRGRRKSMALDTMAPLARVEGVTLTSVLNWKAQAGDETLKTRLRDVSARLTSLEETAALIERLDLVITVDTAVAHLSGAMGKETWLLLHDFADCRWTLTDARSYWYPDVRLYRQEAPGDWDGVIARVRADLEYRAKVSR